MGLLMGLLSPCISFLLSPCSTLAFDVPGISDILGRVFPSQSSLEHPSHARTLS